ncbi:MAG: ornithine cyclodeaminase [Rhodocyclaceae bacterium]|nr:ornithine cyclodeaminase [Rhodocyclaceae bacterium]MCB1910748.1 ornithine cyclodeaminase [Rhodocyclaceae bacterium]MCP5293764.1 ornithine cyclodeaminase [Zoogloeaceae bacterium]
MTRYLDIRDIRRLVQARGIEETLEQLATFIRQDFLRWQDFDKCPRLASHSSVGVIELMPASDGTHYGFKYVNGHPRNQRHGKLTVMAFGVLAEVATGYPLLLCDMTLATAMRTAATSALAAKAMARADARSMAIIGNGCQSEFQVLAFHRMLGIKEIRAFDVDPVASAKLRRNLASVSGLRLTLAGSAEEAASGADIVTTVTADKTHATILRPGMIEPGMHINAIGGDCPGKTEIDPAIVERSRVVVEYEAQSRIEGEIQQMGDDFPVTELWQVLAGKAPGRRTAEEVTLFDSVGFALEDFSTLRYFYQLACDESIGREIELVPELADPRDLFGSLALPAAAVRAETVC